MLERGLWGWNGGDGWMDFIVGRDGSKECKILRYWGIEIEDWSLCLRLQGLGCIASLARTNRGVLCYQISDITQSD